MAAPSSPYQSWSDEELVQEYRRTHRDRLFTELYNRYAHLLYGVARKHLGDIDDPMLAVSDAFVRLKQYLELPDRSPINDMGAWLYTVCRRAALDMLQGKAIQRATVYSDVTPEPNESEQPDYHLEQPYAALYRQIERLPEEQRLCVLMHYFDELSYNEIADAMQFSYDRVRSHIQNGRRNLRNFLTRASTLLALLVQVGWQFIKYV